LPSLSLPDRRRCEAPEELRRALGSDGLLLGNGARQGVRPIRRCVIVLLGCELQPTELDDCHEDGDEQKYSRQHGGINNALPIPLLHVVPDEFLLPPTSQKKDGENSAQKAEPEP
jgi:hypothetical protein